MASNARDNPNLPIMFIMISSSLFAPPLTYFHLNPNGCNTAGTSEQGRRLWTYFADERKSANSTMRQPPCVIRFVPAVCYPLFMFDRVSVTNGGVYSETGVTMSWVYYQRHPKVRIWPRISSCFLIAVYLATRYHSVLWKARAI